MGPWLIVRGHRFAVRVLGWMRGPGLAVGGPGGSCRGSRVCCEEFHQYNK